MSEFVCKKEANDAICILSSFTNLSHSERKETNVAHNLKSKSKMTQTFLVEKNSCYNLEAQK